MANDAHTTLGRTFAIPADPDMLTAMGRALYNFLYLEELLTAVIHYAGAADLSITRGKMAHEKQQALEQLAGRYRKASNGAEAADEVDAAATAFGEVRTRVRSELLHAHPQAQGLGYTARDGQSWNTVARTPGGSTRPRGTD